MDKILASELFVACFVYLDDVVVFGATAEEVINRTRRVLELIDADGLKISGLKCYFLLKRIELLGKTIESGRKFPSDDKL